MKVNNHKDVDVTQLSRNKKSDKAAALRAKEAEANRVSGGASIGDTANVSISDEAKAISTANQAARADTSDQAKIDRVKSMINSGTYKADYGKVADKMINEAVLEST